ncbi:MAG: bestrophin family ion channel [Acidobacteriota bacterium]
MHAGRHYSLREVLVWTRREIFLFLLLASVPLGLELAGVEIPRVPWQPLAVLGTAVAFVTGFKSNAAYGRLWEARKIWGGIVNASRTWFLMSRDFQNEPQPAVTQRLVYRQVAWFTALRHQLRQERAWESQQLKHNDEYREKTFTVPELESSLETDLQGLLGADDLARVLATKNRASAVLDLQSAELRTLAAQGAITEYRHVELARLLKDLFDLQGRCERIKNFPYPRQFATLNLIFVWLFILLVPFGLYSTLDDGSTWLVIPCTLIVAWVFNTMEKIGSVSENPFEAGANDVPISAMSRGIEIDLRELLGEQELPEPALPQRKILM